MQHSSQDEPEIVDQSTLFSHFASELPNVDLSLAGMRLLPSSHCSHVPNSLVSSGFRVGGRDEERYVARRMIANCSARGLGQIDCTDCGQ